MKPSNFEFANIMTFAEAHALFEALEAALFAMVDFGSDDEHMMTLSALKLTAHKARNFAMKKENEK